MSQKSLKKEEKKKQTRVDFRLANKVRPVWNFEIWK